MDENEQAAEDSADGKTSTTKSRKQQPNDYQRAKMIRAAKFLISRRASNEIVLMELMRQGQITKRAASNYVRIAREQIIAETGKTPSIVRQDALAFWESIVTDLKPEEAGGPSLRDKMHAQARIEQIVGVLAPIKVAGTDSQGNDIHPSVLRQAAIKDPAMRELMARLAERAGGLSFETPLLAAEPSTNGHANGELNGHANGEGEA